MMSHRFFCALLSVFIIRVGRCRHPRRSAQTSASVGADIRIGRRRHPHRSAQMPFPMIANHRRVWHPCHTHAATPTQPYY